MKEIKLYKITSKDDEYCYSCDSSHLYATICATDNALGFISVTEDEFDALKQYIEQVDRDLVMIERYDDLNMQQILSKAKLLKQKKQQEEEQKSLSILKEQQEKQNEKEQKEKKKLKKLLAKYPEVNNEKNN